MALDPRKLNWQRESRRKRRVAGLCLDCGSLPSQGMKYCSGCLSRDSKWRRESKWWLTERGRRRNTIKVSAHRQKLRRIVIEHYGNKCACCGISEYLFLELDHVNDEGAMDRKNRGNGAQFFRWIIESGFPDYYQVLCSNCNQGRYMNGGVCPHKEKELVVSI